MTRIDYTYADVLSTSERIFWKLDDVITDQHSLDMSRPFLPEALARVNELDFLSSQERLWLNQIRGHQYLYLFGVIEEMILPFVLEHERTPASFVDARTRSLLGFASEEAKHIEMFRRFRQTFTRQFPVQCDVIGPASAIADTVLAHDPLSVALLVLHIEWFTQRHYVDGIKSDAGLEPLFSSMLRHHWLDESQHARLDTLLIEEVAASYDPAAIARAVDGYFSIGMFMDEGLKQQVDFDLDALERVSGRRLSEDEREKLRTQQLAANRWTYLGTGMTHPKVLEAFERLDTGARDRLLEIAPAFC